MDRFMDRNELKSLLKKHNQEHLLSYYDDLSQDDKDNLASQIKKVDWDLINLIHTIHTKKQPQKSSRYEPIESMDKEQVESNKKHYYDIGIKTLQEGKIAAVLLAGGQGTRLGCEGPKASY